MSTTGGPNFANGTQTDDIAATPATAQTGYSGINTGSTGVTLVAAGTTNGKRINRAWWMPTAAAAAAVVNWWYNPSSTTLVLVASTLIGAVTPGNTTAATKTYEPSLAGFNLPNGTNLYVTSTIAQAGIAGVEGANY